MAALRVLRPPLADAKKNAQTRLITGTGLGLSIVQEILEAHHGCIQAQSAIGEGSCFTVYIPIASI